MANINGRLFQSGFSGVTHADISALTGRTLSASEQSLCTSLISALEAHIARLCDRNLKASDTDLYYETFDAGRSKYYPFSYPLKAIALIKVDGVTIYDKDGSSNQLTLGRDFFVYPSKVVFDPPRNSSVDNRLAMQIYYTIENIVGEDLKLAIKQYVSEIFLNREQAGKSTSSINVAGVSLNFDSTSLPNYLKSVIASYRKIHI